MCPIVERTTGRIRDETMRRTRIVTLCVVIAVALTSVLPGVVGQTQGNLPDIPTGVWPRALGFDGTNVWVANGFDNTVIRYDEATGNPIDKTTNKPFVIDPVKAPLSNAAIPVGQMPAAMAWDSGHNTMWVAGFDDKSLTIVDASGKVQNTLGPIGGHPVSMVYAGTFMWVVVQSKAGDGKDGVWQFDTTQGKEKAVKSITVGAFPTAIVASPDNKPPLYLWVANGNEDTISVITNPTDSKTTADSNKFKTTIPPFPISLAFDSAGLWIGNYANTDDHTQGTVIRLDALSGQLAASPAKTTGRGVNVYYGGGHVFVGTGHGQSYTFFDQTGAQNSGDIPLSVLKDNQNLYTGTVLITNKYVYVADWLNDRLVRFTPPSGITPNPTNPASATPLPPTPTLSPTPPACNLPPQLHKGDIGEIKYEPSDPNNAKHMNDPVIIHDQPTKSGKLLGQILSVAHSEKFTVNSEATLDTKDPGNMCFYNVTTADSKITGWIVQGGAGENPPRYYIEPSQ